MSISITIPSVPLPKRKVNNIVIPFSRRAALYQWMIRTESGSAGPHAPWDAYWSNVVILQDLEDSTTLSENANLGSWNGTPTSADAGVTQLVPCTGDNSLISTNPNPRLEHAPSSGAIDPADGDFTLELSFRANGVSGWEDGTGTTDMDFISCYNATASRRSIFVPIVGDGAGNHILRAVMSANGTTTEVNDWNLNTVGHAFSVFSIDTSYHLALVRSGDNIQFWVGSFVNGADRVSLLPVGDPAALPTGFDLFTNTTEGYRCPGVRASGGATSPSGRYDNIRFTLGTARYSGASHVERLPFARTAAQAAMNVPVLT